MTRDEARSLDAGTTVRYFETARKGKGAARFGRLLSTSGYRYAEVESGGEYGLAAKTTRIPYEEIEVFPPARSEEKTEKRLARRGR